LAFALFYKNKANILDKIFQWWTHKAFPFRQSFHLFSCFNVWSIILTMFKEKMVSITIGGSGLLRFINPFIAGKIYCSSIEFHSWNRKKFVRIYRLMWSMTPVNSIGDTAEIGLWLGYTCICIFIKWRYDIEGFFWFALRKWKSPIKHVNRSCGIYAINSNK
jgi:hypothetical protein